jgi:hypothetical protein
MSRAVYDQKQQRVGQSYNAAGKTRGAPGRDSRRSTRSRRVPPILASARRRRRRAVRSAASFIVHKRSVRVELISKINGFIRKNSPLTVRIVRDTMLPLRGSDSS